MNWASLSFSPVQVRGHEPHHTPNAQVFIYAERPIYFEIGVRLFAVIGGISSGLKSRERSCPYTFLAPGSGVRVIGCRKFPKGKAAGRNASEPRRSLVTQMEEPTLWSEGEGRWIDAGITEVASTDSRGSRGGMLWRKYCAARETRYGGGEATD